MKMQMRKIKKYFDILKESRWADVRPVDGVTMVPTGYKNGKEFPDLGTMKPFDQKKETWGNGFDSHAWFHFEVDDVQENEFLRVRTEFEGWDATNPQFMVYVNGDLRQGLDVNHQYIQLEKGVHYDIFLYAYLSFKIDSAKLFAERVLKVPEVTELYYDIEFPLNSLSYILPESQEYADTVYYLFQAVSKLDLYEVGSKEFYQSCKKAADYLKKEFYEGYCGGSKAVVACIGHTHIDCAWLWTLKQTREKVQRSFGNVLELMNQYPEFKFMSSQALLYENLKEEDPEAYDRVKTRIKEKRWEVEGAMWVEADCNLTSGESLVRQVMYGKNFFQKEFNVESRVLWLPDVFGYAAALPQILKKCGVDWFVTSKISWNDTNRMPYDTFLWKGIDGTEINSYFMTAQEAKENTTRNTTTYNAKTDPAHIHGTNIRYSQKQISNETLITYGFGDGGGGPVDYQLEQLRRASYGTPCTPKAEISFAGDFLKRLEKKMENNPFVPTWQGELYLEFHRGTYTTQAHNKKNNRKSEYLYQNAEWLNVISGDLLDTEFPQEDLHIGWKMILTNQFHDIIPGSSIREVYEQCDKDYARIRSIGERALFNAQDQIAKQVDKKAGFIAFNPTSFSGRHAAKINGKMAYIRNLPQKGYTVFKDYESENHVTINGKRVETDLYKILLNENYEIISIYDKRAKREVLKENAVGNELRYYADFPDTYDAWEWQDYERQEWRSVTDVTSAEEVEDGIRKGIKVTRQFGGSKLVQTIWFYDDVEKIEFETYVDWHEAHKMLKAVFPVDINTDKATYEIQFGQVERSTTRNTSWNQAQYEVCAHKYADVSENGYGVALINDCKFGHSVQDGEMTISLLRAPKHPDPEADQGEHTFTYAICPHNGSLVESKVRELAFDLNNPVMVTAAAGEKTTIPTDFSVASVDCDNVICDTVKQAEDGNGTILRFYESENKRVHAHIELGIAANRVILTDLMEREIRDIPVVDGAFDITFHGFELLTFRVL